MYDPFPLRPPPALAKLVQPFANYVRADTLPLHIHQILLAATAYHVICTYISPVFSRYAFPKSYNALSRRVRLNWDIHVTSLIQSTLVSVLSLWVMYADKERWNMDWRERIWGYTGACGMIQSLGVGYFLWDVYISAVYVDLFGIGMLAHGLSAFWVFGLGYVSGLLGGLTVQRPFVNFYAPSFLLYELSSPFLNIHWFCDKLNLTGGKLQLYNGILLMASFFGSRLIWGVWSTYSVFKDMFRALDYQQTAEGKAWLLMTSQLSKTVGFTGGEPGQVMRFAAGKLMPAWFAYTYLTSNIILMSLNVYWFGKMVTALRKRFEPKRGKKDDVVARGIDEDGVKSVGVGATEVRRRNMQRMYSENPPPT